MSRKHSVLIVDDALFMRKMLDRIISGAGDYEIYEASRGREAVALYTEHRQDIVFLDISMPEMNGIEVLKELKEINEEAYVVMCSAIGQESMIMEAMNHGAAEFIVKPFLPQHIIKALEKSGQ
ncbi:response regulator [Clostridium sp. AM58-1XD]|uniref:response regulator n=1 Tax=Clostridium sp. AM58-1XD TaxID=2292307 RepID=UPI000E557CD7|nr:response regulator [Clostridium sp. AM58-1XD]RGY96835.1 response regulator [Clostridium sp. AM58-1XD]